MAPSTNVLPSPTRAPDIEDNFTNGIRSDLWVAHYLPHWTSTDRSGARFEQRPNGLVLKIEEDQLDWRVEDAPLRVSSLQTGTFSGPPGSRRGTHRHRPDNLRVRTATPTRLLWAPSTGRVDLTIKATQDSDCMVAAWLVGTEHLSDSDSGEVCIFEIDAAAVGPTTRARTGIKAHGDRTLKTDVSEIELPFDATRSHTWTAIWGDGETIIGCEGMIVRRIGQAPNYPMFLMVDLFEIGPPNGTYPKAAIVQHVRGWQDS